MNEINNFQGKVVEWNLKNFGGHFGSEYRLLLGLTEELGELCHAHLKGEQNIRHTKEEIIKLKKDAIGDLVIFLANYCDSQNFKLSDCMNIAWGAIKNRNWTKDKINRNEK